MRTPARGTGEGRGRAGGGAVGDGGLVQLYLGLAVQPGKRQGRGARCEHQDSQGSVYKVCLLDFHCCSNYKLRFSHSAALSWLYS